MAAAVLVRQRLITNVGSLKGAREFDGRWIAEGDAQESLRELLRLGAYVKSAEVRRGNVMIMLEMDCSLDKWRKIPGPEYELMLILAEHMLGQAALETKPPTPQTSSKATKRQ